MYLLVYASVLHSHEGDGEVILYIDLKTKHILNFLFYIIYQVANAVGAALSQVSGMQDTVVSMANISREEALANAKEQAKKNAIDHGAEPDTIEVRL